MPRRPDPTPSSARRKSPARFPFLGLVPRPRRGRSADVATIRRLAERADGLALILEAVHKRAEATAARNIAAELRQAVP